MCGSTSEAAYERISGRVLRVQTAWIGGGQVGTAFYIADAVPSGGMVFATAGHLVRFPGDTHVKWLLQRFDEAGRCMGEVEFEHDEADVSTRPYRYYKHADVAFCVFPRSKLEANALVPRHLTPLPVIGECVRLTAGTRVAWAGYACDVEERIGKPQLCYFEGVVSAFYTDGSRGLYIVDAHAAPGVSGGPVWHFPVDRPSFEVAGIVSQYWLGNPGLPGFCAFEPINPIIAFLKANYGSGSGDA